MAALYETFYADSPRYYFCCGCRKIHVANQMRIATCASFLSSIFLLWRLETEYNWDVTYLIPIPVILPCMMAFALLKENRPMLIFLLVIKALAIVIIAACTAQKLLVTYLFSCLFGLDFNLEKRKVLVIADAVISVITWNFSSMYIDEVFEFFDRVAEHFHELPEFPELIKGIEHPIECARTEQWLEVISSRIAQNVILDLFPHGRPANQSTSVSPKRQKLHEDNLVAGMSPLERLPRELLWKIVDCDLDGLHKFRQRQSKSIEVADSIVIYTHREKDIRRYVNITAHQEKARMLVLRLYLMCHPKLVEKITRTYYGNDSKFQIVFELSERNAMECLQSLGQIIGNRFEYVCINTGKSKEHRTIGIVSKILEGAQVGKLELEMNIVSELSMKKILEFVKTKNVKTFELELQQVFATKPVDFLLSLASHLPSMHITQKFVKEIDRSKKYLLGLFNANWSSIILDMFSRKINSLNIVNNSYKNYLSTEQANELRKKLPRIGKKVNFIATYEGPSEGHHYRTNDHVIKATPHCYHPDPFKTRTILVHRVLSVKHISTTRI